MPSALGLVLLIFAEQPVTCFACVEILLLTIEVVMSTLHMNKKYKALQATGVWYI